MPTEIRQIEDYVNERTVLRVTGEMLSADAVLLEKIALELREAGNNVTLDIADLNLLDSDSAPILKRLEREHGFKLDGMEIFLQKAVSDSEK